MGVEAEVFVSTPDRIHLAVNGPVTAGGFDAADLKGLGHVELATLGALLIDGHLRQMRRRRFSDRLVNKTGHGYGETYSSLMAEMFEPAHEFDEEEWVFPVSNRLTRALASLSDERAPEVARRWGETEEFAAEYGGASDSYDWLRELRALARRAIERNENLYLWSSL